MCECVCICACMYVCVALPSHFPFVFHLSGHPYYTPLSYSAWIINSTTIQRYFYAFNPLSTPLYFYLFPYIFIFIYLSYTYTQTSHTHIPIYAYANSLLNTGVRRRVRQWSPLGFMDMSADNTSSR